MFYPHGKKPSTNSIGSRVDSRAGLDVLLKRNTFTSAGNLIIILFVALYPKKKNITLKTL
jgi:hypothetical protein